MGTNIIAAAIIWIILLLAVIAIPVGIFFAIKHLIKFTTRTIYEEKARGCLQTNAGQNKEAAVK